MNVLEPAVYVVNKYTLGLGVLSYMFKKLMANVFSQYRQAIFCCPNEMKPNFNMRHIILIRLKPEGFLNPLNLPLKWEATKI